MGGGAKNFFFRFRNLHVAPLARSLGPPPSTRQCPFTLNTRSHFKHTHALIHFNDIHSLNIHFSFSPEYPVKPSRCDVTTKPAVQRQCNARCPVDCVLSDWSDWSMCSQNCLVRTVKTRTKYITQLSQYGGEDCPMQADHNGEYNQAAVGGAKLLSRRDCSQVVPGWAWSELMMGVVRAQIGCGYQIKTVFGIPTWSRISVNPGGVG